MVKEPKMAFIKTRKHDLAVIRIENELHNNRLSDCWHIFKFITMITLLHLDQQNAAQFQF